jgi:hypothetical protein
MSFLNKKPETLFFWQPNSAKTNDLLFVVFKKKKRDEQQFIYTFKKLKKN